MPPRRRNASEVVVILWRDIPAQVNGSLDGERHQVLLAHRFQKAIDRAAMVAGKKTAQEYVGEWRRESYPLDGELITTIDSIAARIDAEFTNPRLHALVANGGWDPANPESPRVDPAAIAADADAAKAVAGSGAETDETANEAEPDTDSPTSDATPDASNPPIEASDD